MKADYTFEWYVQEIPPRCRKPRDVLHTKAVEVNIPEFRGVEVDKNAPVAIVVYKKDYGTKKRLEKSSGSMMAGFTSHKAVLRSSRTDISAMAALSEKAIFQKP